MAIIMMSSKEHAEKVGYKNIQVITDYPGMELNAVRHYCDKCPKNNSYDISGELSEGCCNGNHYVDGVRHNASCGKSYCSGCSVNKNPMYMETTHIGVVLYLREMNGYDDSDFYAGVWDEESNSVKEVQYATTRGWTYPNNAVVDASPEIRAKYESWLEKRNHERNVERLKREAMTPSRGKRIRVIKGRKVPHGTEGEIFWVGPCSYNRHKKRVGVQFDNGEKAFIDSANVEVILEATNEA